MWTCVCVNNREEPKEHQFSGTKRRSVFWNNFRLAQDSLTLLSYYLSTIDSKWWLLDAQSCSRPAKRLPHTNISVLVCILGEHMLKCLWRGTSKNIEFIFLVLGALQTLSQTHKQSQRQDNVQAALPPSSSEMMEFIQRTLITLPHTTHTHTHTPHTHTHINTNKYTVTQVNRLL